MSIDLDTPTVSGLARSRQQRLPWLLFVGTLAALLVYVALTLGRPVGAAAVPAGQLTYTPTPDPIGVLMSVERDANNGSIVAVVSQVLPSTGRDVWCRLRVDGETVESEASDGQSAICVWTADVGR